jgi:hypothetical protein
MSKKSKRQVSRPTSAASPRPVEFNPDYSSTKFELKRIAILWIALVLVIILLAVFQEQIIGLFLK